MINPIANVAYTVKDKQYLTSLFKQGNDCNRCEVSCSDVGHCGRVVFKRVRESHKGRRCIKSDFKVGRRVYDVNVNRLYIKTFKISKRDTEKATNVLACTDYALFTTQRAAKAYIAMRKKQRGAS